MTTRIESLLASDPRFKPALSSILAIVQDADLPFVTEADLVDLSTEPSTKYLVKLLVRRHLAGVLGTALSSSSPAPKPIDQKSSRDPQPGDARLERDGILFNDRGFDRSFLSDCGPDLRGVSTRGPAKPVGNQEDAVSSLDEFGKITVHGESVRNLDEVLSRLPFGDPAFVHLVFVGLHEVSRPPKLFPGFVTPGAADDEPTIIERLVAAVSRKTYPDKRPFRRIVFVGCRLDTSTVGPLRALTDYADLVIAQDHAWNLVDIDGSQSVNWLTRVIWLDHDQLLSPGLEDMLSMFMPKTTAEAVIAAHRAFYAAA